MNSQSKNEECCPEFDPVPWEEQIITWDNKKFVKDRVFTLFYMPLNFGKVMKRINRKIEKSGAETSDFLCLSEHTSLWNMDIYMAVNNNVEGAVNTTLSGQYLTKVYEGDFKETGVWIKDYSDFSKSKGLEIKKMYMWYTVCPKCAKKYGGNFVVIVGKIG